MTRRQRSLTCMVTLSAIVVTLMVAPAGWAAPKYKVLHAFGHGQDGAGTWGSLLLDKKGNLYGTTGGGGFYGYGTVFELIPKANGKWSENILHNFDRNGQDGYGSTANLFFGDDGNLYGTTTYGGTYDAGTVFDLVAGGGGWAENVLYSFGSRRNDAFNPHAGVAMDRAGNLYGTGYSAFELVHGSDGWTERVIHEFNRKHGDGYGAFAGLTLDGLGNLYGTTEAGGTHNVGIVYELSPVRGGAWKEHILHTFDNNGKDGYFPGSGALTMDASGNLYGTTENGGCCGGTVFRLTPQTDGHWKEAILYDFKGGGSGEGPGGGVVRDRAGNLYGTTIYGGSPQCGCGVVYKLSPQKSGKWKYTVLHAFVGSDGAQPDANLILDDKGNLYGTAATGGAGYDGVAFEVTP